MATGLPVFDKTLQETNLWLKDLEVGLNASRRQAYAALRATLHALRDRLPPATAMHFAAQLPILLRGVFVEGWDLAERPAKPRTVPSFLADVASGLAPGFPFGPERVAREVFQVIRGQMDLGEVDKIMDHLPRPIRELWLEDVL